MEKPLASRLAPGGILSPPVGTLYMASGKVHVDLVVQPEAPASGTGTGNGSGTSHA